MTNTRIGNICLAFSLYFAISAYGMYMSTQYISLFYLTMVAIGVLGFVLSNYKG